MSSPVDVAIIGAGPYGLSIAAHLQPSPLSFRIFGTPMQSWSARMPKGMSLKSEGFASSLYDPDGAFTLRQFCQENNLPYQDIGMPVSVETFVCYGLEFQRRFVPHLEETDVTSVKRADGLFELTTATGETLTARRVVVAAGISHFADTPPAFAHLPDDFVTHSSRHHDLSGFALRRVAVVGAGASALDLAVLLHEAGADVTLVARRSSIAFHAATREPRPLLQRILNPRSGLGLGWRSRLCTDAPLVFYRLPIETRARIVERHLGPAPCWFTRDRAVDRFPMLVSHQVRDASLAEGQVHLQLQDAQGVSTALSVDHVICATGYRPSLSRLKFLDPALAASLRAWQDTPTLTTHFESSVPGLHFVGLISANSFGPLTRFAYGAKFTAPRIARHLINRQPAALRDKHPSTESESAIAFQK